MIDLDRRMLVGQNQLRINRGAVRFQFEIEHDLRRPFPFEPVFATGTEIDRARMIIKLRGRRDEVGNAAVALRI